MPMGLFVFNMCLSMDRLPSNHVTVAPRPDTLKDGNQFSSPSSSLFWSLYSLDLLGHTVCSKD